MVCHVYRRLFLCPFFSSIRWTFATRNGRHITMNHALRARCPTCLIMVWITLRCVNPHIRSVRICGMIAYLYHTIELSGDIPNQACFVKASGQLSSNSSGNPSFHPVHMRKGLCHLCARCRESGWLWSSGQHSRRATEP